MRVGSDYWREHFCNFNFDEAILQIGEEAACQIQIRKGTGTDKSFENERETKLDEQKNDGELEDYSKGVQSRIAKLTRKMREAERQREEAVQYAQSIKNKNDLNMKY